MCKHNAVTICLGHTSKIRSSACWKCSSRRLLNCHDNFKRGSSPCGKLEKMFPPLSGLCTKKGKLQTRATVCRWIFQWEQDCDLEDDCCGGWPSKITVEIAEYMEQWLKDDDETTSVELQSQIVWKFGANISSATIRRHREYHCSGLLWGQGMALWFLLRTSRNKWNSLKCALMTMTTSTSSGLVNHLCNWKSLPNN